MRLSIRAQTLLLSAVPLLVLVFVLVLAAFRAREAEGMAYWGTHSQQVLAASADLTNSIDDANTAVVDYGRDRTPASKARFFASVRAIRANVAKMAELVADNPAQEARANHLADIVENFLPIFEIQLNNADNPRQQRIIEQSKAVRDATRDFNATLAAFDAAERQLAVERFSSFSRQARAFILRLLVALVAGITLTVFTMFLFGRRLVGRLHQLSKNVERLADGKDAQPLGGTDEIAQLDAQFRQTTMRMREERAISTQLQRALLPQQLPAIAGIRIDASYRPAASSIEIGGDWYDVFVLSDRTIGISMGDVTGHGLLAASTMALVRQSIQTAARYTQSAAAVLDLVNRNIVDQDGAVVSAFVGIFDTFNGRMQYAVAGHPAPITVRASGTIGMLAGSGLLLGVERSARYERFDTTLESGSALVLYTDGLVETFRGDYSRGLSRLIDAIADEYYHSSENIAQAIQNRVFREIRPHDDSAIVFIGVTELGASRSTLTRTWNVDAKDVSQARRLKRALLWHLGQYAIPDEDLTNVELILGELLGNVARHTDGRATVTLELDGARAILHVSDDGAPIEGIPETFDAFAESGRGLFLVNALARSLRIARHPSGNHLTAELPITLEPRLVLGEYPVPPVFR